MKKRLSFVLLTLVLLLSLVAVPVLAQDPDGSVGVEGVVYTNSLLLENKDAAWDILPDDSIGGTLYYNAEGPTFVWGLEAQMPLGEVEYALIYYADTTKRFVDWGGKNPGAVIATVFPDEDGFIFASSGEEGTELSMSLPCPPDANGYLYDYVYIDDYDHATGAKIWLVPSSALATGGVLPVSTWPQTDSWLFETDLITYTDTDNLTPYTVSISVSPDNIDFGMLTPGDVGVGGDITVTNEGGLPVNVTAGLPVSTDDLFSNIKFDAGLGGDGTYGTRSIAVGASNNAVVTLPVPIDQDIGYQSGTIIFWATQDLMP